MRYVPVRPPRTASSAIQHYHSSVCAILTGGHDMDKDIVRFRDFVVRLAQYRTDAHDILGRRRYRTHTRYRRCARRYPVPPHDIARRAHDNAGWHDTTHCPRYRGEAYDITTRTCDIARGGWTNISRPGPRDARTISHTHTITRSQHDIVLA
jgi:hypothetical protein